MIAAVHGWFAWWCLVRVYLMRTHPTPMVLFRVRLHSKRNKASRKFSIPKNIPKTPYDFSQNIFYGSKRKGQKMREIKYRAWDKTYSFYLNAEDIVLNDGKIFRDWVDLNDDYPSDDIELEWYTGLKDKNGKGIFEGDICRYYNPEDKDGICEIKEDYALWISGTIRGTNLLTPLFYLKCSSEWEVIGNIHENPELLER